MRRDLAAPPGRTITNPAGFSPAPLGSRLPASACLALGQWWCSDQETLPRVRDPRAYQGTPAQCGRAPFSVLADAYWPGPVPIGSGGISSWPGIAAPGRTVLTFTNGQTLAVAPVAVGAGRNADGFSCILGLCLSPEGRPVGAGPLDDIDRGRVIPVAGDHLVVSGGRLLLPA